MEPHCVSMPHTFPGKLTPVAPLGSDGVYLKLELGQTAESIVGQNVLSGKVTGGFSCRDTKGSLLLKAI